MKVGVTVDERYPDFTLCEEEWLFFKIEVDQQTRDEWEEITRRYNAMQRAIGDLYDEQKTKDKPTQQS